MPALSPTMESGTITKWLAEPGKALAPGDVLCEVETDKATVAFEVQEDGVLAKIIVGEGAGEVKVGSPVAIVVEDAEAYEAFVKADKAGEISLGGDAGPASSSSSSDAGSAKPTAEQQQTKQSESASDEAPKRSVSEAFAFAPSARHMAHSMGINASSLQGSGRGGRITKADLVNALKSGREFPKLGSSSSSSSDSASSDKAAAAPPSTDKKQQQQQQPGKESAKAKAGDRHADAPKAAPTPPPATSHTDSSSSSSSSGPYTDVPANNIRKVIAKRLAASKAGVPHFYVSIECELDAVLALRKALAAKHDAKVSVNDLVIRASALALRDVPEANAQWSASQSAPVPQAAIDVSVAVATPTGLITPIVTGAAARGLTDITLKVRDLAGRAKEGKLKPEEFQGGTFTVSNLGMFGIDEFSAVINPPQACIVAVGGGSKRVVPGEMGPDGTRAPPRIATVMTAKLSGDRRVVDEAAAAQFLQAFKAYLQKPERMLL